jgi:hypothetical protein
MELPPALAASCKAHLIEAEAEEQALEMITAALQDHPEALTYEHILKLAPKDAPYLLPLPTLTPPGGEPTTPRTGGTSKRAPAAVLSVICGRGLSRIPRQPRGRTAPAASEYGHRVCSTSPVRC